MYGGVKKSNCISDGDGPCRKRCCLVESGIIHVAVVVAGPTGAAGVWVANCCSAAGKPCRTVRVCIHSFGVAKTVGEATAGTSARNCCSATNSPGRRGRGVAIGWYHSAIVAGATGISVTVPAKNCCSDAEIPGRFGAFWSRSRYHSPSVSAGPLKLPETSVVNCCSAAEMPGLRGFGSESSISPGVTDQSPPSNAPLD